jgi:hypothetical protein
MLVLDPFVNPSFLQQSFGILQIIYWGLCEGMIQTTAA